MKNMIIVGANSAIAKEYVRASGPQLGRVALFSRNEGALSAWADDLRAKNPSAHIQIWAQDLASVDGIEKIWDEMMDFVGVAEEVVLASGALGDQFQMKNNARDAFDLIVLNSAVVTYWALLAAQSLKKQRHGSLGVITSVAGVRGRASNYIYGSSKAQLIALAAGMRCELSAYGVRVIDFRPGMVDTPMTAHLKKGLLMAKPASVGADLAYAMEKSDGVVYSPKFWSTIMLLIRLIPFGLFKKMKF
jgi:decaprenylphospho-beta-D-erythro-pentofuranosid-2-ulose 2-reductase